ncbi:hypothetical protein U0070_005297, partial [Myodes glareolus]
MQKNKRFTTCLKKVSVQEASKENPVQFYFLATECLGRRSRTTLQLVLLQAQEGSLSREIFCLEMAVILGSHALQTRFRRCNKKVGKYGYLGLEGLVPHRSAQVHHESVGGGIQVGHADHCQMLKDSYYGRRKDCSGPRKTDFCFGVDDLGLHIHEKDEKLTPKINFSRSETENNPWILQLCLRNLELHKHWKETGTTEKGAADGSPGVGGEAAEASGVATETEAKESQHQAKETQVHLVKTKELHLVTTASPLSTPLVCELVNSHETKVPSPCACTVLSGEGVTEERHEESITKNEKKECMQAAATESELSQARDKSKRTRCIIHMKNMARPTQEQMLQQ